MTDTDIAIFLLLNDAIEARDPDALCALWRRFAQTDTEVANAHAGVDEDDDGTRLEKSKRQRIELQRRRHHEHGTDAAADAYALEAARQDIALSIQFAVGEMAIAKAPSGVSAVRLDQREGVRQCSRHRGQVRSDVH